MSEPAVIATPAFSVARPPAGEYAPYYDRYISLVQGEDILNTLDEQRRQTMLLLCGRDDEDGDFRYSPENGAPRKSSATSAIPSASLPTAPSASRAPTPHPSKASNRTTTSATVLLRSVRWPIWSRTSSPFAAPRCRCFATSMKRRGRGSASPARMQSACARWPTSSRGMSCITAGFWKRSTLR